MESDLKALSNFRGLPLAVDPGIDHRPRKVQEMVLYETVQEHWPAYQQLTGEHGSLPKFVRREFGDILKSGRPRARLCAGAVHPLQF